MEIRLRKNNKVHSHRIRPGKLQWESAEHGSETRSASLVWNTYRNTSKYICWSVFFIFNTVRIKRWGDSAESSQLTCGHLGTETVMVSFQFLLLGKGWVHLWRPHMDECQHVRGDVHRDATVLDHVRILGYLISGYYFSSRHYSAQQRIQRDLIREEPFPKRLMRQLISLRCSTKRVLDNKFTACHFHSDWTIRRLQQNKWY